MRTETRHHANRDGCPEFDERLVDSIFSPAPDAGLERHLADCARCRRARDLYLLTSDALTGVEAPRAASQRLSSTRVVLRFRYVAAAGVLLFLAVLGVVLLQEEEAVTRPPGQRALLTGPAIHDLPVGRREFQVESGEVRVTTPCGTLLCRGGRFGVEVERAASPRQEEGGSMRTGMIITAAVTLTVTSGAVWWLSGDEQMSVPGGSRVVRRVQMEEHETAPVHGSATSPPIETIPFEEPPAAAERRLELEVLSDAGRPVSGVRVILFRGDEVCADTRTRQRGRATVAASRGQCKALLLAPEMPAHVMDASLEPGLCSLRLPPGARVAGRIRLPKGGLPEELVMKLRTKHALALPPGLPAGVLARARLECSDRPAAVQRVGTAGSFEFAGLASDWSGVLVMPAGYRLAGKENFLNEVALDHPRADLDLALLPIPAVRGRVVTFEEGLPVPHAQLRAELHSRGSGMSGYPVEADAKGRFLVLLHEDTSFVRLDIGDAQSGSRTSVTLDSGLDEVTDLGDVRLAPVRMIPFFVRDRSGNPIKGAVAVSGAGVPRVSSRPTDDAGEGKLLAPPNMRNMMVTAVGYSLRTIEVPEGPLTPIPVTLERGATLRVRLRAVGEAPPAGMAIHVAAPGDFFEQRSDRASQAFSAAGATTYLLAMSGDSGGNVFTYRPDTQGEVLLCGLKAGVELDVSARGLGGSRVSEQKVTLRPEEQRVLELRIDRSPRVLRGRVVDETGRALAGAKLVLQVTSLGRTSRKINRDGVFVFEGIFAETVDLMLTCPGCAPLVLPALPVSADGRELRLVMRPGRKVRLSVVDAEEQPQAHVKVFVYADESRRRFLLSRRTNEKGMIELSDLPEGKVRFDALIEYARYSLVHDTRDTEACIALPSMGTVRAAWEFELEDRAAWRIRLLPQEQQGALKTHYSNNAVSRTRIGGVRPGRYLAVFEQRKDPDARFETVARTAETFIVIANRETRIELIR